MTVLKSILVLVLAGYFGLAALMYFAQRSLMYFPETVRTPPARAGFPQAEEIVLDTADGEKIIIWHVAPRTDMPVVLYFHGNGAALRNRVDRYRSLVGDGTGLVALSYRGYGGSTGRPTETGLLADAAAAYAFAVSRYPEQRIVVWGESLGSGVAVALAADKSVGRIVLEAPFASAVEIAARAYPFLPVRWLMKDQFRSDERIGSVTVPLLILHGAFDRVVPIDSGERLFDLARGPKHFVRFPAGDHEGLDGQGAMVAAKKFIAGGMD